MLCLLLDIEHLHVLVAVMRLLNAVSKEPNSQMTAATLAAIMTPNILRPRNLTSITTQKELATHSSCVAVVQLLIESADEIGSVPMDIVKIAQDMKDEDKARKQYEKLIMGRGLSWWYDCL